MGRTDRPLDESTGPLHQFAAELRLLRDKAGNPTYLAMARASGKSRTALAEAAGGDHVPTWATVEAYVRACDGDVLAWERRWEELRQAVREGASVPAASPSPVITPVPPAAPRRPRRRGLVRGAAGVVAVAVVSAVVAVAVVLGSSGSVQASPRTTPVTVQNKVALGADILTEDSTPAYLSYKPLPYCKSLGCAVPGTDHLSGDVLASSCTTTGDMMTNFDTKDILNATNPDKVRSTLWYGFRMGDGRTGYLSEVYLTPASRGGLGLPSCS